MAVTPTTIILRRKQVELKTGLPRATIYEQMAAGTFPRPVPLGGRAVGWLSSEVEDWIKSRISARDSA